MDIDYTEPFEGDDYFPIEGIDYPAYDEHSLNEHLKWKPIRFNPNFWDANDEDIPF